MKVPMEKLLTEYERKIVAMWTVGAFITYAAIACAVVGMVMIQDVPPSESGTSVHTKNLNSSEGAAAADLRTKNTASSERSDQQAIRSRMTGSASAQ